jgi:4a-hydroxytetrahydrobiopterin dehydratase
MSDEKERTYSDAEATARIQELGLVGWYLEDGWLRRKYNTDGWPQTLMATNAIGYLCEAAYHHADLSITWGKLWVKLKTHSAGAITDKDFDLARKIEEVVLWRPTSGALGNGNPEKFVYSKTSSTSKP